MLLPYGQVLTEHLGNDSEIESKDRILSDVQIHNRDMEWLRESDLVIAEISIPSLGVGYEIGRAVELGKPVLSLYRSGTEFSLSAMVSGSEGVRMIQYERLDELTGPIRTFISSHVSGHPFP